jgi:hypothetical protein
MRPDHLFLSCCPESSACVKGVQVSKSELFDLPLRCDHQTASRMSDVLREVVHTQQPQSNVFHRKWRSSPLT